MTSVDDKNKNSSTTKKKLLNREFSSLLRDSVVPQLLDKTRVLQSKHRLNMTDAASNAVQGLQLAPLRPLDEFILGSARFQLPNFKDWEKWGNRVVKNLCYYQTNYFILIGVWLVLTLVYQPKVAIYSTAIITASLFAAKYCIETYGARGGAGAGKENLKYLLATVGPALLLMYFMDLIVFVLFVVLMPFCSELSSDGESSREEKTRLCHPPTLIKSRSLAIAI